MLRPRFILLALPVLSACATRAPETPTIPPAWRFTHPAPPVVAQHVMVVSEHQLSSDVGAEILRRGGNAIDAAVAVGFAQAVVSPRAGNIGGGGFLVYRQADGQVFTLDYRETAPAAATHDMYLDAAGNPTEASVTGALAAGVPGSVAGLAEMHHRFGHLPWRDVVEPAVRLAREGHVVDSVRAVSLEGSARRLRRFSSSVEIFFPVAHALAAGTTWRQPDLAGTLELIRDSGAAGFYRGRTADLIVAEMRRSGGIITREDLAAYRPIWREPLTTHYRGWTIYGMPPSSSGGVTLAMIFNILEGWKRLPPVGSAELMHIEIEAMRRAFVDRNRWLGDPAFVSMPLDRLLSKDYAAELRRQILPDRATPLTDLPTTAGGNEGTETTHYAVVDSAGNAVSITTTLNDSYGSALVVRGAGFLLNDEMDDFASKPGAPNMYGLVQGEANAIAPGKRMLSAMTPTIALNPEGRLELVLGAPGGPRIITAVMQVVSNVIDHHMSLTDAVSAPRIHHQALPDSVRWESGGLDPDVRHRLEAMGHHFFTYAGGGNARCANAPVSALTDCHNAVVEAIRVTPHGLEGVADLRLQGGAAGW
jgi:gamma-glutamyltranspeptidase / glutathione hydrolase